MAQKIKAPVKATVIDNLRLARGRIESAEWFTVTSAHEDHVMVRSLAQTAIYALQDVLEQLDGEATELRRPVEVTEAIEAVES